MDIDTKITPSLHPDNIKAIEGYSEETAPHVALAIASFENAYRRLEEVHKARAAADSDQTLNEAGKLLKVATFAEAQQKAITKSFDTSLANMTKTIDALEGMLSEPLKAKAERPGVANEVRAHVKALTVAQREAWFNERQRAGDLDSLEIVLGAHGYLSGLSDDERAVRTRFYHQMKSPDVAKRLQVLKSAREMVETRGPLVFKELEKAIGADFGKIRNLQNARTESEKAFLMRETAT